jgi:hypothetical protein
MSEDEVIGRKPKVYPNWHRIKVYTVRIDEPIKSTIWYAAHKGKEFHVVLSSKYTGHGWDAQFRVVDISEDASSIRDPVLLRYINPCDCSVVKEKLMRIIDRMERLLTNSK